MWLPLSHRFLELLIDWPNSSDAFHITTLMWFPCYLGWLAHVTVDLLNVIIRALFLTSRHHFSRKPLRQLDFNLVLSSSISSVSWQNFICVYWLWFVRRSPPAVTNARSVRGKHLFAAATIGQIVCWAREFRVWMDDQHTEWWRRPFLKMCIVQQYPLIICLITVSGVWSSRLRTWAGRRSGFVCPRKIN